MTYTIAPNVKRAALTCSQDERKARANLARMEAQADAADVVLQGVIRIVKRQCWERYSGYDCNVEGFPYIVRFYDGSKITIDKQGNVDWGSFTFQAAAE